MLRAKRVPWLGVWPATTAERFCARVGAHVECWSALELLGQRPPGIPERWRRGGDATRKSSPLVVTAPSVACVLDDRELSCQGSEPWGGLARVALGSAEGFWPHPLALGRHHGCVRQELDILCWGRGDHGELGFPATERCQDAGRDVACSREPRRARVQGEAESHPPLLAAGDTYTCAVTSGFVECWGKSRDGFFRAPGPARIPRLRLNGVSALSAGPRGLCGDTFDEEKSARCVGAIAAPPRGVTGVAVSQGDDASACGIDAEGIVCWGEAYSPRGRRGAPVRVVVDADVDPAAPVVDTPGHWDAACRIERPCTRDWVKLSRCEGSPDALPWATLAPHAAAQSGKLVRVTGNFVVGPGSSDGAGCGRLRPVGDPHDAPMPCCDGGTWNPLGLESHGFALLLDGMGCDGDGSRLCCSAPATGQALVASGILDWDRKGGTWTLREPELCSLE